ncbi:MAG: 6-hydroxymethylpterin diphosphokinase MptE-like protein [Spirochaetota bacterium]
MSSRASKLIFERSRAGGETARYNGRYIHSRFDPIREARRFVEQLDQTNARILVFLGPGLGHAIAPLRERFPGASILGIFLHPETYAASSAACDSAWHPESAQSLREFLAQTVPEILIGQVSLVEWQPTLDAFAEKGPQVRAGVLNVLRELQASLFTTGASGRLRFHNAVKNLGRVRAAALSAKSNRLISAMIVVAAGPSLEESIPIIRRARARVSIWATGSSVEALLANDLIPDVVVVTEPSVYASLHVRSLVAPGRALFEAPTLLVPLTVTNGVAESEQSVFFAENDLPDRLLAAALPNLPVIPSRGTVTFTAIAAARSSGDYPVILAGADFAHFHERSHVRPHLAHNYRLAIANRTSPGSGFIFERTRANTCLDGGWTTDRTLTTYANWLRSAGRASFEPLYQLSPSAVETGLPALSEREVAELPAHFAAPMIDRCDGGEPKRELAATAIREAQEYATQAAREAPPALNTLANSRLGTLATHLAIQPLLRFTTSSAPADWVDLCEVVSSELRRALEFLS